VTSAVPAVLAEHRPPGRAFDRAFRALALVGAVLVLVVLVLIAWVTVRQAWPAFRAAGLDYLTSDTWDPTNATSPAFGTLAFSFGTVVISGVALVISVPISVGIALFITEVAPPWMRNPAVYVVDLLAAVPSVVYGLWGALVLAPALPGFFQDVHDTIGWVPVLGAVLDGSPISGKAFMTGGLILAVMVTPIITAVTREAFVTVPRIQKDAALALGATRWEMIRAAVLPHGRRGMVAGILIGFGRAIGETIAVALVIGSTPQITEQLFSSGDALPAVIANQFGESTGTYRAALIGMGVVLFVITFLIGVGARAYLGRRERRTGATA